MKKRNSILPFFYGLLTLSLSWIMMCLVFGHSILGHSSYDSYTLMALAWRKGLLHLEHDYQWLELAIFNGDFYVSFPSVPALVMWVLTFPFGSQTPNTLFTGMYLLFTYCAAYRLARLHRRSGEEASFLGLFLTMGCSLFAFSLDGGVWNQAQLLSFLLVTLCAVGLSECHPVSWAMGLFALALSVGCRPFQAVYVPFALWSLWKKLSVNADETIPHTLLRSVPYLIAPTCVAIALAWYNYIRFGSLLEFGHNYLPEFTRDPESPQMALKYILPNLKNLLRLPTLEDGKLAFPKFNGFAFWLNVPMFVTCFISAVRKAVRRGWHLPDTLLWFGFVAELFLLLAHKTLGGWQFGTRYLCDLLPMMLLFELRSEKKLQPWEIAPGILAIVWNIFGACAFELM